MFLKILSYIFLSLQVMYPSPFMPMPLYPSPMAGYHPYYGPMVYRPHPALYQPGVTGKVPGGRGSINRPQGPHKPKTPAQLPNLPLQRDDDERMESPKLEQTTISSTPPPKQAAAGVSAATIPGGASASTAKKSSSTTKKYVAVQVPPRMPGIPVYPPHFYGYPPYMMQPGLQEDPRFLPMGLQPQPPYYYTYPHHMPRGAYPYMVPQPVHVQIPTRTHGSGSSSPASSSEDRTRRASMSSPTESSMSDPQSVSPGSSVTHHHPQHIQLMPNVVHVPSHLLYPSSGSGNNSRSSTPVLSGSPGPNQPPTQVKDSPRNSQGEIQEFPRRRNYSGPRPVSQSPSYSSQSSHESSTSPTLNGDQLQQQASAKVKETKSQRQYTKTEKQSLRVAKNLTLNTNMTPNTTGFSYMFKDELGTPTEVTNVVRMIEEENREEGTEEERSRRAADQMFQQHHSKPSPPAGRLYLNLPVRPGPEAMRTVVTETGEVMTHSHQLPAYRELSEIEFDPSMLEPQTPMTPAGFHTPGAELTNDPLEILRNLNINNDTLNRSAHGHF